MLGDGRLRWRDLYGEAELYKAALRVYTKPLFSWRKALSTSTDGRTLYDFARRGPRNLESLHKALTSGRFAFRPGTAIERRSEKKARTIYLFPWEDRIVDLLLYRLLSRALEPSLSPDAYAYRGAGHGLDLCQTRVRRALRAAPACFLVKRDIASYFASVDHGLLLERIDELVPPGDYLSELLRQRVRFQYAAPGAPGRVETATRGIAFGTATACALANLFLARLDAAIGSLDGVRYFRYADDILVVARDPASARRAADLIAAEFARLRLASKPSHHLDAAFSAGPVSEPGFEPRSRVRHLGLEFRAGAPTALSRDKLRKIRNLFRRPLQRRAAELRRAKDPARRAALAVRVVRQTLERGVRNVALIDYYLRHVEDEEQLRRLDRWLAEEVLAVALGTGHKKGNFRRLSFASLRALGLPSLAHRARLLRHGHLPSSFFVWKTFKRLRACDGTAARPRRGRDGDAVFSPGPEAAALACS